MVNTTTQFNRDSDNSDTWAILILLVAILYDQDKRNPSNRCITGQGVVDNLLNSSNLARIHSQLRMNLETFFQLRNWLQDNTKLCDSRWVTIEEKLLIFISISSTGASNRDTQEKFNRGANTISQYYLNYLTITYILANLLISCFHEVIDALLVLYKSNVMLPTPDKPTSTRITENYKYVPYFKDCLGVLDGIYIEMQVPIDLQPRYRNRKGILLQNILAVCTFEMQFVYILAGWEGSAHDSRVLSDAQVFKGFVTPVKKFWLGKVLLR
jgi:hypothetical protein